MIWSPTMIMIAIPVNEPKWFSLWCGFVSSWLTSTLFVCEICWYTNVHVGWPVSATVHSLWRSVQPAVQHHQTVTWSTQHCPHLAGEMSSCQCRLVSTAFFIEIRLERQHSTTLNVLCSWFLPSPMLHCQYGIAFFFLGTMDWFS